MPTRTRCPECGAVFSDADVCPACLCDTLPDALHRASDREQHPGEITSPELTPAQQSIDRAMRANRGVR